MLYIMTALSAEARPLIGALGLKKKQTAGRFRIYENESRTITLVITGPGCILSAAAAGMLFGNAGQKENFLLSFGCCADLSSVLNQADNRTVQNGKLYIADKIVNADSGRTFYPDLLIRNDFTEATVVTGSRILTQSSEQYASDQYDLFINNFWIKQLWEKQGMPQHESGSSRAILYDMESAAIYEAGSCFLGPHEMSFLRVVTDNGNGDEVTPEDVNRCVTDVLPDLLEYIAKVQSFLKEQKKKSENCDIGQPGEKLAKDMDCSVTMRHQLTQLLRLCTAAEIPWEEKINALYAEGILPVKSRREGKKVLERLQASCIN